MADEEKLNKVFSSFNGTENELIPVLQKVQEECGFLSEEAMLEIAKFLRIPESRVYTVATFYSQFRFTPVGKNHICLCRGTACHVKGAPKILEQLKTNLNIDEGETTADMKFSLESVACIGACGLAPTIVINKNTYGRLDATKVDKIITKILSLEEGGQNEN